MILIGFKSTLQNSEVNKDNKSTKKGILKNTAKGVDGFLGRKI
jgi:hypothetical protein